jgi:hypothetical protein
MLSERGSPGAAGIRRVLRTHPTKESTHIVSTTMLVAERRQNTSIHPPDTEDRQILTIPDREDQRRLGAADRLSLRVGLWLLERSLRSGSTEPVEDIADRLRRQRETRASLALTQPQAIALLTYDLQRRML